MKPGFKPKNFTKKEWQDNRDKVCKASGVGAALDKWQEHCVKSLSKMTVKEATKASYVATLLTGALNTAKKKCDKTKHKADIDGIEKYLTITKNFLKAVKQVEEKSRSRAEFVKKLTSQQIRDNSRLNTIYLTYAANKGDGKPQVQAYVMTQKGMFKKAVEAFGEKGSGEGKYNIAPGLNHELYNIHVTGSIDDKSIIENRHKQFVNQLKGMIYDNAKISMFKNTDAMKEYAKTRFPVVDFTF